MLRRWLQCASLALIVTSAATVFAENPLDWMPGQAGVVVRLKNPKETMDKIAAFADSAQPGTGDAVRGNLPILGLAISNPTLTGVDQARDWYVAALFNSDSPPTVVFAIPTTDGKAFQKALPENFEAAVKDDWLLYSEDEGVLATLTEAASAADATARSAMDEKSHEAFEAGDLSAFVNVNELTDVYQTQIEQGQEQAAAFLNQIEQLQGQQSSALNMPAIVEMYRGLLEGAFQGLKDANALTVSVHFDEGAIRIEEYIDFEEESASAERLAQQNGSAQPLLNQLVPGAAAYYGFSGDVEALQRWGLSFSAGMMNDDQTRQRFESVLKGFQDIEFGEFAGSFDLAEDLEGGVLRATNVVEAKPIDALRKLMRDSMTLMAAIEVEGLTQEAKVEKDAETYGEAKADVVTIVQEFEQNLDPLGMQRQFQEILFGDGMETRILYLKDRYLQTMGGGREQMETALAALDGDAHDLSAWRTDLAEEPNLLFLLDLPGLAAKGLKIGRQIPDLPLQVSDEQIDSLEQDPSYLAIGITAESHALRCQTRIPAEQLSGALKIIMFARQMQPNN